LWLSSEMKCVVLILLLASIFSAASAASQIVAAYSGTTIGGPTWNAPNVVRGVSACTVGTTAVAYANFSVAFPSAGVYQIQCMFESVFKSPSRVFVFSGPFVASTATACTGFVKSVGNNLGLQGGPPLDDGIYFTAATYSFAVTGTSASDGGIFACEIKAPSWGGSTIGSHTILNPVSSSQSSSCNSDSAVVPGGMFSWTQPTSGLFDLAVYFSNGSFPSSSSFGANAAIYSGSLSS